MPPDLAPDNRTALEAAVCTLAIVLTWTTLLAQQPSASPPPRLVELAEPQQDGGIRIVYQDGSGVLVPLETAPFEGGMKVESYSSVAVAVDKRTVGWLIEYENCCTSYPIPLTLVLHQDGKERLRLQDGLMMYEWYFWAGGREVVFHADTVHGNIGPHAVRVDIATGRKVEQFDGNVDDTSPSWTRKPQ